MKQSAIPYLAMVCLQLAYVGSNFLCKAALDEGMSIFVFVLYRHIIAMSILGPFAYYQERERRPRLTVSTTMKLSFLALIGITFQQNVHYAGLRYATPTVASALNNLIPAVTFVMAVLFRYGARLTSDLFILRMETVSIHSLHGQAKVFGTLVCIGGALIFTFWKGVVFKGFQISMFNIYRATPVSQRHDWIKGSALLTTSYIAFCSYLVFQVGTLIPNAVSLSYLDIYRSSSLNTLTSKSTNLGLILAHKLLKFVMALVIQAAIYREFPAPLSMTALVCSFSSLQALVVALAFERHSSAWRLSWNLQLITIIYCVSIQLLIYPACDCDEDYISECREP
ncbi:WAT1-related protein [Nymphaea thermarum]|nr:WAT1-related protein [Nymphaea thermarum]